MFIEMLGARVGSLHFILASVPSWVVFPFRGGDLPAGEAGAELLWVSKDPASHNLHVFIPEFSVCSVPGVCQAGPVLMLRFQQARWPLSTS
jgi:hypothetical protein